MPTHAWTRRLAPDEWLRLAAFGVAVAALHAIGCGLFVYYSSRYPSMAGLGLTAYLLGLRHAFDADHIAAIDNTTRKLLQEDQRPIGVGFFFSLGHSSVVFALVAAFALGERTAHARFPAATHYGYIGTGVSGTFLWIIGILNLIVLA